MISGGAILRFFPVEDHDRIDGYRLYILGLDDPVGYHLGKPVINLQGFCEVDLTLLPGIEKYLGVYLFGICKVEADESESGFCIMFMGRIGKPAIQVA